MDQRGQPLDVDEAIAIVVQALEGLAYAHAAFLGPNARGLVHRDIKPGNILLCGSGSDRVAKVGDFGLAKAFDRAGLSGHSVTGAIAGTLDFMARQQLINDKYAKPEVDVWSTAATLYWMVTGKAPRRVPANSDPILAVLNEAPVPICNRRPGIPKRIAEVLDTALAEDSRSDISTAAELSEALRAAT